MATQPHGGKRNGAGRPKINKIGSTAIRVRDDLLPTVEFLKEQLAAGNLITVQKMKREPEQTWAFSLEDMNEQSKLVERLTTTTARLEAEVQMLKKQLAAALQNSIPEPEQQQQGETSEPLNLIPNKVFKYLRYDNERLVAQLPNDSRWFYKDKGDRWSLFVDLKDRHFVEKDGQFYLGTTEIFPVKDFKGKLPKTLIEKR
jgi:hypothetical protein